MTRAPLSLVLASCAALAAASTLPARLALAGDPPAAGEKAPAVSLPSQDGKTVSLEEQKGKWVVLYFYPKDFTSGCTLEAHNFQRDLPKYRAANAVILGVSVDTVDSHREFCTKESLDFRLLADVGAKVSNAYGSTWKKDDRELSARNTFLVDPAGTIRKVYLKVNPAVHSDELLADLAKLAAAK